MSGIIIMLMTKAVNHPAKEEDIIPAGAVGQVIDIMVEDGEVKFLLDFADLENCEWYSASEIENTDDCTTWEEK